MTQQSVIGASPFNSLAFGKLLQDDLYSNINQTDNSTVFITPRYNTTGKTELKVSVPFYMLSTFSFILKLNSTSKNRLVYCYHLHKKMII